MTSISIKNVSLFYNFYSNNFLRRRKANSFQQSVKALNKINLEVKSGESIGLLGPNGSGKSTLLKLIAGVLLPSEGEIIVNGKIASLLSIQAGFNPKASGLENIYIKGYFMGWSKKFIASNIEEIISFSGLNQDIHRPFYTYSSGMKVRLAFAMVTTGKPDIVLMDEWLGVADKNFSDAAQLRLNKFIESAGILILASHNNKLIAQHTTRIFELNNGAIIETK